MSELIDRQNVIDRLKKAEYVFRQNGAKLEANGIHYALELVESDIEMPTIEPYKDLYIDLGYEQGYERGKNERPQGEWIEEIVPVGLVGIGNGQYRCSNCQHGDVHAKTQEVPFCWYCGAKMDKKEADDD